MQLYVPILFNPPSSITKPGALQKGSLANTSTGEYIEFQYNPEQETLRKNINYQEINAPGVTAKNFQYINQDQYKFDINLLFDNDFGQLDVDAYIEKIESFAVPQDDTGVPPTLLYTLGHTIYCIITAIEKNIQLRYADATTRRAIIRLSLQEIEI